MPYRATVASMGGATTAAAFGSPVAIAVCVIWGSCICYRDACFAPPPPPPPARVAAAKVADPHAKDFAQLDARLDSREGRSSQPSRVSVSFCSN